MEMTTDVVFDNGYLTIYLHPDKKQIHLKWKGFATSAQFREGLRVALELVREKEVEYWLGDLKFMEVILPQDEEWATTIWFPAIAATGLKKMAIITSLDFLNNSAVKRMVTASAPHNTYETRYFVDAGEAASWLEENN
jgi:hypothetical protein